MQSEVWFKLRNYFSHEAGIDERSMRAIFEEDLKSIRYASWPAGISLAAVLAFAWSSVEEKQAPAPAPTPVTAASVKVSKTKAVEVDGVISAVGQRTVTF
jgi:hypothetical protein